MNARGFLMLRARRCERRRGLTANIVAVGFYDRGDLLGVTRTLNGLPADAEPSYRETG